MRFTFKSSPWLPLALAVLVGGCASGSPERGTHDAAGVTVVGVTRRDGVAGINRNVAARDLVRRLEEGERRRVVGPERARSALGAETHAALMARYTATGLLDPRDVRLLAVAPLDTRFAVLARIESDVVQELAPRSQPLRDARGAVRADRVGVERATRRTTIVSAVLVDLVEGRVRWLRRWSASPVTRGESVRYRGSSFSGSVAALLANRLVGGSGSPDAPPPAPLKQTLEALFDEIETSLPGR